MARRNKGNTAPRPSEGRNIGNIVLVGSSVGVFTLARMLDPSGGLEEGLGSRGDVIYSQAGALSVFETQLEGVAATGNSRTMYCANGKVIYLDPVEGGDMRSNADFLSEQLHLPRADEYIQKIAGLLEAQNTNLPVEITMGETAVVVNGICSVVEVRADGSLDPAVIPQVGLSDDIIQNNIDN